MFRNMKLLLQSIISVFLMLSLAACASNSTKSTMSDKVEIEYSGLFTRQHDLKPTTWLTLKVTNTSDKAFDTTWVSVFDVFENTSLYGANGGLSSSGFSSDPFKSWPKELSSLEPGGSGYVTVNLGKPKGSIWRVFLALGSANEMAVRNDVVIDATGIEPVNQMASGS